MGVDRRGGGEIRRNRPRAKDGIAKDHGHAGKDERDQGNCRDDRQPFARDHCDPPILPPNVQPGHIGIALYGKGTSDRGTGDGKPGPREVSKVRNPQR